MPDELFANPRLAAIYDTLDGDRSDLAPYVAMCREFDARSVLDVGCGTGTLAFLLATEGVAVVGVDPAEALLAVARSKPGAGAVHWILGDATKLPPLAVDLATMTGNVAQVFVADDAWEATLSGIGRAVRPGGRLVFESRIPARRAWEEWNPAATRRRLEAPGVGVVDSWVEVTDVALPMISFRHTFRFASDGSVLTSDSTLRFRERDEIEASLDACGWSTTEVRDAPDRPGKQFVFIAVCQG